MATELLVPSLNILCFPGAVKQRKEFFFYSFFQASKLFFLDAYIILLCTQRLNDFTKTKTVKIISLRDASFPEHKQCLCGPRALI